MSLPSVLVKTGDCRTVLKELAAESVQMICTSPPYWGLRDYQVESQIGLEPTPAEYVTQIVAVFAEAWRVLKPDGVVWLNLGDNYSRAPAKGGSGPNGKNENRWGYGLAQSAKHGSSDGKVGRGDRPGTRAGADSIKPKNLIGIPWRVAFALQDFGWYLRSEITWCKRAPMPESVTDRPTSATEKIFLLTKNESYYYDADAVRNPPSEAMLKQVAEGYNGTATKLFEDNGVQDASEVKSRIIANARKRVDKQRGHSRHHAGFNNHWDHLSKTEQMACGSNMRNYWLLGPESFDGAHFATFPTEIPRRCILAGSKPGDTVLDPFFGSGTTGQVALELGRNCIGIELNEAYAQIGRERCNITPGFQLA